MNLILPRISECLWGWGMGPRTALTPGDMGWGQYVSVFACFYFQFFSGYRRF